MAIQKYSKKYYVLHYFSQCAKTVKHTRKKGENAKATDHFLDFWDVLNTMSKSSVKHNTFCYTFLTKSDKMGTCPFGVENVILWTTSLEPMARAEARSGNHWKCTGFGRFGHFWSKNIAKSIMFYTTFRHGLIW